MRSNLWGEGVVYPAVSWDVLISPSVQNPPKFPRKSYFTWLWSNLELSWGGGISYNPGLYLVAGSFIFFWDGPSC